MEITSREDDPSYGTELFERCSLTGSGLFALLSSVFEQIFGQIGVYKFVSNTIKRGEGAPLVEVTYIAQIVPAKPRVSRILHS